MIRLHFRTVHVYSLRYSETSIFLEWIISDAAPQFLDHTCHYSDHSSLRLGTLGVWRWLQWGPIRLPLDSGQDCGLWATIAQHLPSLQQTGPDFTSPRKVGEWIRRLHSHPDWHNHGEREREVFLTGHLTTEYTANPIRLYPGYYMKVHFQLPSAVGAWPTLMTWRSDTGENEVDSFEFHPDDDSKHTFWAYKPHQLYQPTRQYRVYTLTLTSSTREHG